MTIVESDLCADRGKTLDTGAPIFSSSSYLVPTRAAVGDERSSASERQVSYKALLLFVPSSGQLKAKSHAYDSSSLVRNVRGAT